MKSIPSPKLIARVSIESACEDIGGMTEAKAHKAIRQLADAGFLRVRGEDEYEATFPDGALPRKRNAWLGVCFPTRVPMLAKMFAGYLWLHLPATRRNAACM
jgi:hypothetical protein